MTGAFLSLPLRNSSKALIYILPLISISGDFLLFFSFFLSSFSLLFSRFRHLDPFDQAGLRTGKVGKRRVKGRRFREGWKDVIMEMEGRK